MFYKKWEKYNEIQLTKKQNGLKYSKNNKSSTLPFPSITNIAQNSTFQLIKFHYTNF